jgi:hypothetical protein
MNITQEGEELHKMREEAPKGLGDDIKKLTKAARIDIIAKGVARIFGKEDCGCEERANKLNRIFPYKNKENGGK